MNILITGSKGLIGSNLMKGLKSYSLFTEGFDKAKGDNLTRLAWLFRNKRFDIVMHFAAYPRVFRSVLDPSIAYENYKLTYDVLEHCRKTKTPILFASSREVYESEGTATPYAASKLGSEKLIQAYGNCYNLPYIIFRFSNVYGTGDPHSDRFVPLIMYNIRTGKSITLYGDKTLDFTYVEDVVKVIQKWLEKPVWNKIIPVGTGKAISLTKVINLISSILDKPAKYIIEKNRTGEIMYYKTNTDMLKKDIGYVPDTSLKEGLEKTLKGVKFK